MSLTLLHPNCIIRYSERFQPSAAVLQYSFQLFASYMYIEITPTIKTLITINFARKCHKFIMFQKLS
jgi:hypothetical protein